MRDLSELQEALIRIAELEAREQKHVEAERSLRESEENYRKLFELAPNAIYILQDGNFIFANEASARLFGYSSPQALIGRSIFDFVHPEYLPLVQERLKFLESETGNEAPHVRQKILRMDGSSIDIEVGSVSILYKGKKAIQVFAKDISEESRAKESLELFRKLMDQSNDAIFVADPETSRILDANEKAWVSLGYTREELLKLSVVNIEKLLPDISQWQEHIKELREKGAVLFQGIHVRKDGSTFPAEINIRLAVQEGKEFLMAVARNISNRRRLEQEIYQARQDWEDVFNTISDMITLHDADFNIVRANKAAEKILGLPLLNVNKVKCFEYYHGTMCPPQGCPSCKALQNGKPSQFEVFEPHLNIFMEVRAIPRLDENGKITGLIHVVRDITERKAQDAELERYRIHLEELVRERTGELEEVNEKLKLGIIDLKEAQEQLRRSEERFRTIFERAPIGITLFDRAGHVIAVNNASEHIFGYSLEELKRLGIAGFSHPEDFSSDVELFQELLEGKRSHYYIEKRYIRKDRKVIWGKLAVSAIPGISGLPRMIICMVDEITERKEAEEKALRYYRELERSNKELEGFAYIASHDLKDPLLNIAVDLKLLERNYRDKIGPDGVELINGAINGAMRMQHLISELLSYSRVGMSTKAFQEVDLSAPLKTALENLRVQAEEVGARILIGEMPVLRSDPVQMLQLFQNLIGNALKFRSKEPPLIHIESRISGGEWLISVRDNGIGIPAEFKGQIFQIFQRANRNYPGAGIGLAVCKKIVDRHGGRIWVESEEGKGSTFYFTLPAS